MKRSLVLLVAVMGLGVIIQPHEARAVGVGEGCNTLGATGLTNDQLNMVACLYNYATRSLVWKQLSIDQRPEINATFFYENDSVGAPVVLSMIGTRIGIGDTNPQATLDVAGTIKAALNFVAPAACATNNEGTEAYSADAHSFCFCNGSSWVQMANPARTCVW